MEIKEIRCFQVLLEYNIAIIDRYLWLELFLISKYYVHCKEAFIVRVTDESGFHKLFIDKQPIYYSKSRKFNNAKKS